VYTQITYPWAQRFVPFLLGCAYSGISYAGFMSTQNFIFSMIGKFARHLPTGEWSQLYQAVEKIGQQANALMLLDDKTFEDELCAMDSETRQTLLGMDDEAFYKQVKHQAHYDQQIAEEKAAAKEPSFFSRLFCCAKTSEQTPLLSDTTEGFGYV
ncbi:MAG: hypothetical protein KDH94_05185, partial [Coxiellaceae bacterium]|nr:hypothetical protein [Coxiellaceae bacterium]